MLSQGIHTRTRRTFAAAVAALAVAAASLFFVAGPAWAHDELIGTDPAADAALDALPAEITFTFSEEIADDEGASQVQVTDAAGTSLVDGPPVVKDNVLTQPLAGTASGAVTVLWKVVSSDGHPISGEFAFTVAPPATESPSATPTPSETAVATATPEPSETVIDDDPNMAAADMTPWLIAAAVAIALLVIAVVYLLVSRSRRERALDAARGGSAAGTDPDSDTPSER